MLVEGQGGGGDVVLWHWGSPAARHHSSSLHRSLTHTRLVCFLWGCVAAAEEVVFLSRNPTRTRCRSDCRVTATKQTFKIGPVSFPMIKRFSKSQLIYFIYFFYLFFFLSFESVMCNLNRRSIETMMVHDTSKIQRWQQCLQRCLQVSGAVLSTCGHNSDGCPADHNKLCWWARGIDGVLMRNNVHILCTKIQLLIVWVDVLYSRLWKSVSIFVVDYILKWSVLNNQ